MILLRILGLVVAVILLGLVVSRFRRRSLTLGDALIMGSVALGLTVVAIVPSAIDPLLTELGFPPGDERRVIGVLVLSHILLFVLRPTLDLAGDSTMAETRPEKRPETGWGE